MRFQHRWARDRSFAHIAGQIHQHVPLFDGKLLSHPWSKQEEETTFHQNSHSHQLSLGLKPMKDFWKAFRLKRSLQTLPLFLSHQPEKQSPIKNSYWKKKGNSIQTAFPFSKKKYYFLNTSL